MGGAFPERDHVAVAEEDADWIGDDLLPVVPHRPRRDQHLMTENLDLGPLVGGDGILEGQITDLKAIADHPRDGGVVEPLDIDPQHRPGFPSDRQLVGPQDRRLRARRRVTPEEPENRRRDSPGRGRLQR